MENIRWGLLSTANINRRLIPAILASKQGELTAVASRNRAHAQSYARKWEIPFAFGTYQEMLDSNTVDAVYIGLPNHLHAEWSIKAMQAGLHVLCEKPFALTLEDVEQMIAVSKQTGCVLAEAFMYRHHPQTKIIGQLIQKGHLGEITLFRGIFNFHLSNRENVRLVPEYGGGCLWDVGVYPLSMAQFVFDSPPNTVFGMSWIGESNVDEVFTGQMVYSNGGIAQIASSFRTELYTHAEVIGTLGRLNIEKPFVGLGEDHLLTFYPNDGQPEIIPVPDKELYIGEVEDIHAAILDGENSYLTLDETRNHIRTALALYKSAKIGQSVKINSI
jgi:predicted dehydrogenase